MMLAVSSHEMSQSSVSRPHEHLLPSKMTTSLAILPSQPPMCGSQASSQPRRPKLHLNTSQINTFRKGSSLRLEALSAVSPTARNTFSNAYEAPSSAAPALNTQIKVQEPISAVSPTSDATTPTSASTCPTATPSSSIDSTPAGDSDVPYKLPHNVSSILSNSPIRSLRTRRIAMARPMFPLTKRVAFRTPLVEEIVTVKYTMAHSDLESSVSSMSSDSSAASLSSTSSGLEASPLITSKSNNSRSLPLQVSTTPVALTTTKIVCSPPAPPRASSTSPRIGEKRDSSDSESDNDSCPETPVAGRRKRRREWVWTLGPIRNDFDSSESSNSSASSTSSGESSGNGESLTSSEKNS